ncbi:aspartate--ammonia ligase [Carboxylicivirga sediminis]|uniref:Aspartate--ammonia ligase n=1 Tax=Carboxylicivirga sediminis TaxID=2006564 RepID=A0A941F6R3_9BACT|nr:aspartate--ammonia ligase [Carboxylicivirga sediminis]MBR8537816.1 aspartate--ammonia ligase [Carboxylicivirga sediminis]
MAKLFIPKNYEPQLDLKQTEHAIKTVKDHFQTALSAELRLRRVTAPLFVMKGTGINDDLNGTERPVAFPIKEFNDEQAEVVHSLAKWKRMMLADYEIEQGYGLYTDMNAIRPDEELSNIHSLYVDQWDWERHIGKEEYNLDYLKHIVRKIYEVMKRTEFVVFERYPSIQPILPEEITFIQAQDLLDKYPDLTSKEREDAAAKEHGAIFIIGIGSKLSNGEKHDGRAPDYDDWSTPTADSYKGLNGDIVVWNPILERSFEISSMGIRVSPEVLSKQLDMEGCPERKELLFHQRLLDGELPLSIGGGIGQSRLCMFFLRKAHIGEIQSSIWPADMRQTCKENKIILV